MTNEITRSAERRIKELEDELERMRPVVEAARKWWANTYVSDNDLCKTIRAYESTTATASTEG